MRIAVVILGSLVTVIVAACGVQEPELETRSSALESMDWAYWDQGAITDPAWKTEYPETWPAGRGPLGYGESYLATTVGYGPDPAHKHITTYFRNQTFIIEQRQEIEGVFADVMYDDGVVLYIQGQRVFSAGLPAGDPVSPTALATGHEAENRYQRIDLTPFSHLFDRGYVEFAAEVHQSEPSSSDLVFDARFELQHTVQVPGVAIGRGATWAYWDRYVPQTDWTASTFDDAAWRSGAAPLGYGESYIATPVRQPTQSGQAPTTLYRRIFDIEDTSAITSLTGEVMYDDGVVIWLNGTRIDSLSMPAGDATFQTLALGHEAEQRYETRDWSQHRGLLREHGNVLAVELHQQDRTSSDAVFDLALRYGESTTPPPPPGEDIARGATWTYWDQGGDQGTAWRASTFDDGGWGRGAAPLGYGESYLATTVGYGPDASHKYRTTYFRNRFTVADADAVTSLVADLMYDDGVVVYINGTEVKRLFMPSGTITASTLASGHETGPNYERHDLSTARSLLVDGVNVIAVEVHQSSDSSSDLTFDLALDVTAGSAPPPPPPPAAGIARGSSWRYLAQATAPGCCWWYSPGWDDAQWPLAPGPLGYGESYLGTTIPYGPDPANKYMTTYFRNTFFVEDPALVTALVVELLYDDGVQVYLNGQRVLKLRLPEQVDHTTPAYWHEANNTYETFDLSSAIVALQPGVNTIAVEVHNETASSSDLVFDLALRYETRAPETATPRHSLWQYQNSGALADGWQTSSDHSGWSAGNGPLGYNNDDVWFDIPGQPVTSYSRRRFTVTSPAEVTELRGELLVDDGAVVYLNGTEIARPHMPTGTITADTRASSHESNGKYEVFDWSAHRGLLRAGENVLAVEVHQDAAHSTTPSDANDLSFDLAFEVITASTPRIAGCTPVTPSKGRDLNGVWIAPGGAVWASGQDAIVGRRTASGWAWCRAEPNVDYDAVWGSGDNDVWFAGTGGIVQRWNGGSFATVSTGAGSGVDLSDIWGAGPNDVFVVGSAGTIRRFDGEVWHDVGVGQGRVHAVWGASAQNVWAVGQHTVQSPDDDGDGDDRDERVCYASIYRWTPAAQTFALEKQYSTTAGSCRLAGLSGSGADDVWAVGIRYPDGAVEEYGFAVHYDGVSWSNVTSQDEQHVVSRSYTDVAARAPGAENGAWIVAAGRGAVRWDGATWDLADEGVTEDLHAIDARGMAMFAVGRDNRVVRWNGVTWVNDQ
jgi:hypothetical protein